MKQLLHYLQYIMVLSSRNMWILPDFDENYDNYEPIGFIVNVPREAFDTTAWKSAIHVAES